MNSPADTIVVAYVPSPHRGYVEFFRKYAGATLLILGKELIQEFQPLVRHLPGNDPDDVAGMVRALGIFAEVRTLMPGDLEALPASVSIVMPDEDVSRALAKERLADRTVMFDGSWRLRWDWGAVNHSRVPEGERIISLEELDQELMGKARILSRQSSDWWRQVGALLVKDGVILLGSYNRHFPSEQSPYLEGDPRSNFGPGESIEVSSALHAEIGIIAEAAKRGIATEGCDLYVTTFPCPPCAYACASSGIRRLYYADGYSLLAGADALTSRGVEIIRVEMTAPSS
jgi:dCMP deaminase